MTLSLRHVFLSITVLAESDNSSQIISDQSGAWDSPSSAQKCMFPVRYEACIFHYTTTLVLFAVFLITLSIPRHWYSLNCAFSFTNGGHLQHQEVSNLTLISKHQISKKSVCINFHSYTIYMAGQYLFFKLSLMGDWEKSGICFLDLCKFFSISFVIYSDYVMWIATPCSLADVTDVTKGALHSSSY
jgi:hypothetical protein